MFKTWLSPILLTFLLVGEAEGFLGLKTPKGLQESFCGTVRIVEETDNSCRARQQEKIEESHHLIPVEDMPSHYSDVVVTSEGGKRVESWFGLTKFWNKLNGIKNKTSFRSPEGVISVHLPPGKIKNLTKDVNAILDQWFLRELRKIVRNRLEAKLLAVERLAAKDPQFNKDVLPFMRNISGHLFKNDGTPPHKKIRELFNLFPDLLNDIKDKPQYNYLRPRFCHYRLQDHARDLGNAVLGKISWGIFIPVVALNILAPGLLTAPTLFAASAVMFTLDSYGLYRDLKRIGIWWKSGKLASNLVALNKAYEKRAVQENKITTPQDSLLVKLESLLKDKGDQKSLAYLDSLVKLQTTKLSLNEDIQTLDEQQYKLTQNSPGQNIAVQGTAFPAIEENRRHIVDQLSLQRKQLEETRRGMIQQQIALVQKIALGPRSKEKILGSFQMEEKYSLTFQDNPTFGHQERAFLHKKGIFTDGELATLKAIDRQRYTNLAWRAFSWTMWAASPGTLTSRFLTSFVGATTSIAVLPSTTGVSPPGTTLLR